ncbi:MAG: hypothetical protein ACJ786_26705 [Catenulispora sp.]
MFRIPLTLAVGALAALLVTQPALAYVGAAGRGAGVASVSAGQPLTVAGTNAVFAAGAKTSDPPVAVAATVSNHDGFHRWVHTVTAAFGTSSKSGCGATDYRINGGTQAVHSTVKANGTLTVSGISVSLLTASCKGSTVTVAYSVS